MNTDELVALAFQRLPVIPAEDHDSVERHIRQLLGWGISIDDAIKINYYTEEVSPHFEEEFALRKMKEIYDKYPDLPMRKMQVVYEEHPVQVFDTRRLHE